MTMQEDLKSTYDRRKRIRRKEDLDTETLRQLQKTYRASGLSGDFANYVPNDSKAVH
jgi:hypothetical protein